MAVIVQEQVNARWSGVLFTCDPVSGTPDMVLECCQGLGERLVAGEVTPQRARIGLNDDRLLWEAGSLEPIPGPREQCALAQLISLARHLASERGQPLDIEWCIDDAGQLMLVQCRPFTGGVTPAPMALWSNANIAENYPGPVVPMLSSFASKAYAAYFRGLGEAFGVWRSRTGAMAPVFEALVAVQAGRLYYNLSNIHSVVHLMPGGNWLARSFNSFTGTQGMPAPQVTRQSAIGAMLQTLTIICKAPCQYLAIRQRIARFEWRIDRFANQTSASHLAAASNAQLAQRLRDFLNIRLNRWTDAALADSAAMVCYSALQLLLDRWFGPEENCQLQNDLLQGLPELASAKPVQALWALTQQARGDPALAQWLGQESATHILEQLDAGMYPAFGQALTAYLDEYGFRYSGELMLTQPTPAENPLPVIRLIQTYLEETGPGPRAIAAQRAVSRQARTDELAAQLTPSPFWRRLPLPSRARAFRCVLAATQGAIGLRERARMKQALLYTRLRHAALALGERLVDDHVLESDEDVFFLTLDEAIALAEHKEDAPARPKALVATRRAQFARDCELMPPDQFECPVGQSWRPRGVTAMPDHDDATRTLVGTGACGGEIAGRAAVVLDATEARLLNDRPILVTRQTDPGWASVFFMVSGLVIERGGMLSHGAIIAREYGIPAVVGVKRATELIRNGDVIQVDGGLGKVQLPDE